MPQPHGTYSLLWYPKTRQIERSAASNPLRDPTAFALHRRLGADLGFQFAHVEVGAELLEATERPAFGASIKLLWIPLLPSRCLLTAEDHRGVLRVLARDPRDETLAGLMEHLELECAWAVEEAGDEPVDEAQLASHLENSAELAVAAVEVFRRSATQPPFWQVAR